MAKKLADKVQRDVLGATRPALHNTLAGCDWILSFGAVVEPLDQTFWEMSTHFTWMINVFTSTGLHVRWRPARAYFMHKTLALKTLGIIFRTTWKKNFQAWGSSSVSLLSWTVHKHRLALPFFGKVVIETAHMHCQMRLLLKRWKRAKNEKLVENEGKPSKHWISRVNPEWGYSLPRFFF